MKWIRGDHFNHTSYWLIVGEMFRRGRDCFIIIDDLGGDNIGWVDQDICDKKYLNNLYSYCSEEDVPEDRRKEVFEYMSDPFYEIELERYRMKMSD